MNCTCDSVSSLPNPRTCKIYIYSYQLKSDCCHINYPNSLFQIFNHSLNNQMYKWWVFIIKYRLHHDMIKKETCIMRSYIYIFFSLSLAWVFESILFFSFFLDESACLVTECFICLVQIAFHNNHPSSHDDVCRRIIRSFSIFLSFLRHREKSNIDDREKNERKREKKWEKSTAGI